MCGKHCRHLTFPSKYPLFYFVLLFNPQSEENLIQRLNSLSVSEIQALLSRYFDKVIGLRDVERKLNLKCSEMEVGN